MLEQTSRRITRKEKRSKQIEQKANPKINFNLKHTTPLTQNQKRTFESYKKNKNLFLHGIAGTGKTFLALYLSLEEVMNDDNEFNNITIVRSIVPTRDIGFLPGNSKEKSKVYESPYYNIFSELFGRGDAYEYFKQKNVVDFINTSYIRGTTFNNSIIVVDECENLNFHELDSVITRIGKNCKIVFCGDFTQSDLSNKEKHGILDFIKIIKRMKQFDFIEFSVSDIVRSEIVKNYIISKEAIKDENNKVEMAVD